MAYHVQGPTKLGWVMQLLHKLVMVCTVPFLAPAKAHEEVLQPFCECWTPGVLGDIPEAIWE